jgi:hypothetical protein
MRTGISRLSLLTPRSIGAAKELHFGTVPELRIYQPQAFFERFTRAQKLQPFLRPSHQIRRRLRLGNPVGISIAEGCRPWSNNYADNIVEAGATTPVKVRGRNGGINSTSSRLRTLRVVERFASLKVRFEALNLMVHRCFVTIPPHATALRNNLK